MLRFKHGGKTATTPLTEGATFEDVKAAAAAAFGVSASGLTLWGGFPPKRFEGADSTLAAVVGIRPGQQLDVRCIEGPREEREASGGAGRPVPIATPPSTVSSATTLAPASWSCSACTFSNPSSSKRCEMCETPCPAAAASALPKKMVRHVVEADNNCLFTATGWASDEADHLMSHGNDLRRRVAAHIRDHPEQFTEAVLGRKPADYVSWLLDPEHWGGGVELAVLSALLSSEVVAIDVKSGAPLVFGEDKGYRRRIFLIYDGESHLERLSRRQRTA